MVASEKKTQEEDRISDLPDHLIGDILTVLPTKDSVRTSFLSTRWRNLCSLVPHLDLDSRKFSDLDAFVSCANRCFDTQRESSSCLQKLCLTIDKPLEGKASLLPWVDAVTIRNIQHLDISILGSFKFHEIPVIPLSVYTSKTLVHLKLKQVVLVDAEVFSLPCLKVMELIFVRYHNVATLEKLISGPTVLEDFQFTTVLSQSEKEKEKILQVRSQTLKRIDIRFQHTLVVTDAPRLQCLRTRFNSTKNYKIISSGFPAKVDIHFGGLPILVIHDILTEISEVRDLAITTCKWKYIFRSPGRLIQFCYLSRLRTSFSTSDLKMLPNLLECCPILESLILELYEEPKTMFSTVPPCLVSSLKFVELRSCAWEYKEGELNLARYFLKNSTILEKLSVWFYKISSSYDILKEHLVAMPRCSSTCQVVVRTCPV